MLDPNTLLIMAALFVANARQVIAGVRDTWAFLRGLPERDLARAEAILAEHAQEQALSDLAEQRQAILALAAIAPQLEQLPSAVEEIRYQVTSNGGGSMRDDVASIKRRLEIGDERFDHIEARVGALEQQRSPQ